MSKKISKSEAIKTITQSEPMEVLIEHIDRNDTPSTKQTKLSKFLNAVQKQVKEERDILLFSIKEK